jgi:phosphoribosylaminoimidazole carboxylase PurE protein
MKPLVVILMGSKADMEFCQKIKAALDLFSLNAELRIGSAHKTSMHVFSMLKQYEADPRPKVYITVAGRSNALSGFTDGLVTAPVIACPPPGDAFAGADIYSSLRMPSGIAPAVILDPVNAALLAAKILAFCDATVLEKVINYREQQAAKILEDDRAVTV